MRARAASSSFVTRKACPICATVTTRERCPECAKVSLVIPTLTYGQLLARLGNEAGSELFRAALKALKGAR